MRISVEDVGGIWLRKASKELTRVRDAESPDIAIFVRGVFSIVCDRRYKRDCVQILFLLHLSRVDGY